jgi:hypothetical protein
MLSFVRDDRIAAFDVRERPQDRFAPDVEAIATHPLNFTDPNRNPCKLGGIRVDLLISMPNRTSGPMDGKLRGKPSYSASTATRRSMFLSSRSAR